MKSLLNLVKGAFEYVTKTTDDNSFYVKPTTNLEGLTKEQVESILEYNKLSIVEKFISDSFTKF